jgi:hypothetical protein
MLGRYKLSACSGTILMREEMQAANSLALGTSPVVRALIDPEGGMEAVRNLDGISFANWFRSHGGSQGSIDMMWDPIGTPPPLGVPPQEASSSLRSGLESQKVGQRVWVT